VSYQKRAESNKKFQFVPYIIAEAVRSDGSKSTTYIVYNVSVHQRVKTIDCCGWITRMVADIVHITLYWHKAKMYMCAMSSLCPVYFRSLAALNRLSTTLFVHSRVRIQLASIVSFLRRQWSNR